MSYILDALTKSQRERQRHALPTLATEHVLDGDSPGAHMPRVAMWLGGVSVIAIVLAYAMTRAMPLHLQTPERGLAAAPAPAPALENTTPPAATPAPKPAISQSAAEAPSRPPRRAPVEPPSPVTRAAVDIRSEPLPRPTPQAVSPATMQLRDELLALEREPDARKRTVRPAAAPASSDTRAGALPARDASPDATHPPTSNLPGIESLPAPTRATLPALTVNAHAYAQNPEQRMIIINMKRYAEGETMREGPVVESITPRGAVLSYDERRFELPVR